MQEDALELNTLLSKVYMAVGNFLSNPETLTFSTEGLADNEVEQLLQPTSIVIPAAGSKQAEATSKDQSTKTKEQN